MVIYFGAIFFIVGTVVGSFANCAAYRMVRGEDFIHGRSHCPACGTELTPADLVPVLSYILSRGRCRHCGEHISIRYPVTELIFGALMTGIYIFEVLPGQPPALWVRDMVFTLCLFILSLTDMDIRVIPDGCLVISAVAWLLTAWPIYADFGAILTRAAAGFVMGGGFLIISLVMDRILKKDTLGGGDIKLFAVVGLYIGFLPSLFCIIISSIGGLLAVIILRKETISFGPFIAGAAYFMLLWGVELERVYLGL